MKKMLSGIICFLFISVGAIAQQSSRAGGDSVIFDKLVHDYGTISQGANGYCEFTFTNNGKTPLLLTSVNASCGCTAPEWTKEPILPGEKGVIKVKYNTNLLGGFNKAITVSSNAINSPVVLRVRGTITPRQ